MKLVQFENGMYGLRMYWFFGWRFLDLKNENFTWSRSSKHFKDCMADKETCEKLIPGYGLKYKVIK